MPNPPYDPRPYIESVADSEAQLAHFGWSGRRAPTALQAPGQSRALKAPRQGDGRVFLDWKEPAHGGKPGFYTVEVREMPDGEWKHAANAVESETTLVNQPDRSGASLCAPYAST